MLEFDAGVIGDEAPVGLGVVPVAVFDPGIDLASEGVIVGDAPIEALASQDGEFGFRQIKPGPMLGREDPLEAVDQAARLSGGEGLVERRLGVDVQVVLQQRDALGLREVGVGDVPQDVRIVDGRVAVSDFDVSPTSERLERNYRSTQAIL